MFADEGMGREFMAAIVIQRRCRPCSAPPAGTATRSEAAAGCPAVEVYFASWQACRLASDHHSSYPSLSAMKKPGIFIADDWQLCAKKSPYQLLPGRGTHIMPLSTR